MVEGTDLVTMTPCAFRFFLVVFCFMIIMLCGTGIRLYLCYKQNRLLWRLWKSSQTTINIQKEHMNWLRSNKQCNDNKEPKKEEKALLTANV